MKKKIIIIMLVMCSVVFAQIVEEELQNLNENIEFINYSGRYRYRESIFEILSIGKHLSDGLKKSSDNSSYYHNKYSVLHCVDEDSEKFGADIISIDEGSRVEHIRNIRTIIASYLVNHYNYSGKDANGLAYFITIYNALYYKNIEFFKTRYQDIVTTHISNENAGLSLRYDEWPGRSKIIIPLKGGRLQSFEVGNPEVVKSLDEVASGELKEREKILEIQKKEIEEDKKEIQKANLTIDRERTSVIQKEKEIEEKKDELMKIEEALVENKKEQQKQYIEKELTNDPEMHEMAVEELAKIEAESIKLKEEKAILDKEISIQTKELGEQKKELEQKQKKNEEKEKIVKEKEELTTASSVELAKAQAVQKAKTSPERTKAQIEKKAEELAKKEMALAKKEESLRAAEASKKEKASDPKIMAGKLYYLKVKEYSNDGHYSNEMCIIEPLSRTVLAVSDYTHICGKNYLVSKEGIVVIGHKGSHTAEHYLTLLEPNELQLKAQGDKNIFFRSFVVEYKSHIYAVLKEGNSFYLGKFSLNMELVAKSDQAVFGDTFVSFYENSVFINDAKKNIIVFDLETLRKQALVNP